MTNSDFLKKFQQMELGVAFERIIDSPPARICYCSEYNSEYWNYAFLDHPLTQPELVTVEEEFIHLNRPSTMFFEKRPEFGAFFELLKDHQYDKKYELFWFFYEEGEINKEKFDLVRKVETEEDLKIFLQTFDASYRKDDPQDPHGELGGYLVGAERDWQKYHEEDAMEYFTVFKQDKPVAVATLVHFDNIGYISHVGSLKEVSGEGFARLATFYCVLRSKEMGNEETFMVTEEGTFAYDFYLQNGFKKRFSTLGYTKQT